MSVSPRQPRRRGESADATAQTGEADGEGARTDAGAADGSAADGSAADGSASAADAGAAGGSAR